MRRVPFPAVVAAVMTALVALAVRNGMTQFPGMDGGAVLNAAWSMHRGLLPYRDIPTALPPAWIFPAGWAFDLGGVRWSSLVWLSALWGAAAFGAQCWMFRRMKVGPLVTILLALAVQSVTTLLVAWWWYNPATSVAAAVFLTSAFLLNEQPEERAARIAFAVSAGLFALTKPNVAGVLIALSALSLLAGRARRTAVVLLAVAAVVDVAVLAVLRVPAHVMLASYLGASGRVFSPGSAWKFFWITDEEEAGMTLQALAPALALFAATAATTAGQWRSAPKGDLVRWLLGLAGILAGLVGMATNNDYNMVDTPPALVGMALPFFVGEPMRGRRASGAAVLSAFLVLAGFATDWSVTRARVQSAGDKRYFDSAPLWRFSAPPLFDGLRAGPELDGTLRELRADLERLDLLRPGARVYFGPRVDFGAAAFGFAPERGVPLWWNAYGEMSKETEEALLKRFREVRFDACVFARDDFTFLPNSVTAELSSSFVREDGTYLSVYARRPVAPAP